MFNVVVVSVVSIGVPQGLILVLGLSEWSLLVLHVFSLGTKDMYIRLTCDSVLTLDMCVIRVPEQEEAVDRLLETVTSEITC